MLREHTAMPYYTFFDTPEQRKAAYALFKEDYLGRAVRITLGLTKYRCGEWAEHPQFCMECVEHEIRTVGVAVLHREHQLPGVVVCWKHGTILIVGCKVCDKYPISGAPLVVAGQCKCAGGVDPLPLLSTLPGSNDVLDWLARESAYIVQAAQSKGAELRDAFAQLVSSRTELSTSGHPDYGKLAQALEERYGADMMRWLGWPAFKESEPSRLWGNIVRADHHRTPTVLNLLIAGLLAPSLYELEREVGHLIVQKVNVPIERKQAVKADEPEWAKSLDLVLHECSFRVTSAADRLRVTPIKLMRVALRQRIRVPLSDEARRSIGPARVQDVRTRITSGESLESIKRQCGLSIRKILFIELDDPELLRVAEENSVERYRQRLRKLKEKCPGISRSEVQKQDQATYKKLRTLDRKVFESEIPRREDKGCAPRWIFPSADHELAQTIRVKADEFEESTLHAGSSNTAAHTVGASKGEFLFPTQGTTQGNQRCAGSSR